MKIRSAVASEAADLSRLAAESKGRWGYAPEQIQAWANELVISPGSIERRPTWVAEALGELAGFYQLDLREPTACLEHLWVHPRFMRRGVGRALLSHAIGVAADAGWSEITIDSDPHSEPFYLAFGASRTGFVRAPIAGQPDRIRPQLRLGTVTHSPPNRI